MQYKLKIFAIVLALFFATATAPASAATTSQQLPDSVRTELLFTLRALLADLQQQLATLQLTESHSAETTKDKKQTVGKGESFVHIENLTTKKTDKNGVVAASSGDRIEFTWITKGMKECTFVANDGRNSSSFENDGYQVITAPSRGSYDYSVACTDIEGGEHYTKATVRVSSNSNTDPKILLEVENRTAGTAFTTKDILVDQGDELGIRWDASEYDDCKLTHTSYSEIMSYETSGYFSNITRIGRPGVTVTVTLSCEKDMDGPDITGYEVINVTTRDPEGIHEELG